ncbi:hypothetical protein [Methylobacterium nigriterrae]|uniref:hypothetical protein n=1 Tax=Methylobacterium nigriterrae TaxID=3127512 RepID=UPI0030133D5F
MCGPIFETANLNPVIARDAAAFDAERRMSLLRTHIRETLLRIPRRVDERGTAAGQGRFAQAAAATNIVPMDIVARARSSDRSAKPPDRHGRCPPQDES